MFFFFIATATTEIYTLSLHDALPISRRQQEFEWLPGRPGSHSCFWTLQGNGLPRVKAGVMLAGEDRKSTRLNSSHLGISYAVFCLKKKKKTNTQLTVMSKDGYTSQTR